MLRFFLIYKSTFLALTLALLITYLFFIAPEPESNNRIVTRDDNTALEAYAPGARPSPIHSRFGFGTSTISASYADHQEVRVVTTTGATQAQPEEINTTNNPVVIKTPSPEPTFQPVKNPEPTQKPVTVTPAATPVVTGGKTDYKWGVFAGSNPSTVADFENRVESNPDYLAYFVHWGNGGGALPAWLTGVATDKNRTLVLFWEASDYLIGGTNQPAYSYDRITAGDWDDYFVDFADQLRDYPGEVILIPFSELNGNWTPWSGTKNGNTAQKAVAAWRHVHGFVGDIPGVQIGIAYNAASVPNVAGNQIEDYYPGDAYVDIVGVDGFNDGPPWYTFEEIFVPPLNKLSRYGKPMMIFSFASAEGAGKAKWMTDGFYDVMPRYPGLVGWVWFNQNKERNWLLWSDDDAFEVFKTAIGE